MLILTKIKRHREHAHICSMHIPVTFTPMQISRMFKPNYVNLCINDNNISTTHNVNLEM